MTTTPFSIQPAVRHAGHQLTEEQLRERLQQYIAQGRVRATQVVQNVMDVVPQDRVLRTDQLQFSTTEGERPEVLVTYDEPGKEPATESLHRNGIGQLAGRFNIPMGYVDHMVEQGRWGTAQLVKDLQAHAENIADRYLVRSVGGQARAVLSDKFRRIDCRPSALALIEVAKERGLIVSDGIFTETRTSLKFILPKIIEVVPGEHMVFGFDWSNSDFGRGANDLRMFMFRLLCWNGAIGESVVRQIHIGKRLEEDVAYSEKTYKLDAEATASALRDTAAHAISEVKVTRLVEGIRAASAKTIDGKAQVEALKKKATKADVEAVVEAFNSPDVVNMPAGNSLWRWSNAISFVAGNLDAGQSDKKIDLERWAGDVLGSVMPKATETVGA